MGRNEADSIHEWFAGRSEGNPAEEVEAFRMMLARIYRRSVDDSQAFLVLAMCPETGWIVECFCRAPLPPGWRKSKCAPGDVPMYASETSGDVVDVPPTFRHFVRLAELSAHARQTPESRELCGQWVQAVIAEVHRLAEAVKKTWTGPHLDQTLMEEFWHCPSTGVSVWEDPCNWATFIETVALKLLETTAFVKTLEQAPAKGDRERRNSKSSKGARSSEGVIASRSADGAFLRDHLGELPPPETGDAWAALDGLVELSSFAEKRAARGWEAIEKDIASQPKPESLKPKGSSMPVRETLVQPSAQNGGYGGYVPPVFTPSQPVEQVKLAPAPSPKVSAVELSRALPTHQELLVPLQPMYSPVPEQEVWQPPQPTYSPVPEQESAPEQRGSTLSEVVEAASVVHLPNLPHLDESASASALRAPPSVRECETADDMPSWRGDSLPAVPLAVAAPQVRKLPPPPSRPPKSKHQVEMELHENADDMEEWIADSAKPAPTPADQAFAPSALDWGVGAPPTPQPPCVREASQAMLRELAERLRAFAPDADPAIVSEALLALERIPVTVEDLKITQLGVLTQRFKDHPDKRVSTVVKRLRHSWKEALRAPSKP